MLARQLKKQQTYHQTGQLPEEYSSNGFHSVHLRNYPSNLLAKTWGVTGTQNIKHQQYVQSDNNVDLNMTCK